MPDKETEPLPAYGIRHSIGELTPNLCELCGVPRPVQQSCQANPEVTALGGKTFRGGKAEKVFVYAADAVGIHLMEHYPELAAPLRRIMDLEVPSLAVMPSVTPVCFGTIFSGVCPEIHGIRQYEKKILRCETLFDVFPRAGKHTAILSGNNCSIDTIFRLRPVDYFSFDEDLSASYEFAARCLPWEHYDIVVIYDGRYDMYMHAYGVDSAEALNAFTTGIERFSKLMSLASDAWRDFNRVAVYCSDHGAHDHLPNRGTHGSDCREDLVVHHFYRVRAAGEK